MTELDLHLLRFLRIACGLLLAAGITSCATDTPPQPSPASAPMQHHNASSDTGTTTLTLVKGMAAAVIMDRFGKPQNVEQLEEQGIAYEIWTYHTHYQKNKGVTATSVKTVPLYNPFTNTMDTEIIPEFQNELETISITTEFLIIEGKVMEWKQTTEQPGSDFQ